MQQRIMSLQGKRILVAGATGEVGAGAAHALHHAGASVVLVGRNADKLKKIRSSLGEKEVELIVADYSTLEGAKELKRMVSDQSFDVVVASSGPWWPVTGPTEADLDVVDRALNANLKSHIWLYQVLAPLTKSRYIMVNGAAAMGLPATGLTGVCANAVVGFARLARAECDRNASLPDFTHVMLSSSVGHADVRPETIDANEYGRVFVTMAQGKHEVDNQGTIQLDDDMYSKLVQML